jgi:hypothetical protein
MLSKDPVSDLLEVFPLHHAKLSQLLRQVVTRPWLQRGDAATANALVMALNQSSNYFLPDQFSRVYR